MASLKLVCASSSPPATSSSSSSGSSSTTTTRRRTQFSSATTTAATTERFLLSSCRLQTPLPRLQQTLDSCQRFQVLSKSSESLVVTSKQHVDPILHVRLSFQSQMLKVQFSIQNGTKQAAGPACLMHACSRRKNNVKRASTLVRSKRDARVLEVAQVAFQDLIRHTLRLYLCCKNLHLQLLESDILKYSAAHEWLKVIPSLHQNLKRKIVLATLVSVMLLMVGAPISSPNSITWALTEENLIFLEAWRTIDRAYIDKTFNGQSWFRYREEALRSEPMNNREQTHAAIRKMLMTLEDPFTRFLEPEKFNTLRTGTRGAVTGVGLEVGFDMSDGADANLVVIAPVIGGPAERAGILPGDIISEIDGISTKGMGLYDAAQRLQGPESSEVKLTLQTKRSGSSNTILLVRERIKINPVSWRLCEVTEEGQDVVRLGYIRLATFNENASRSVKEAIQKLKEGGATAYILDMRNNSGGLFPAGVEIAKMWLEKGVIVYITDSVGIRDIYEADGNGAIAINEPLAVLVNKGTASASEILAGALKDNKRAVILGEPTFGKGKIQSVFELSDGSGLAVTIARYETPAHVDIDKVGITPDRPLPAFVPLDKEDFCRCLVDFSLPCHMSPAVFFSK